MRTTRKLTGLGLGLWLAAALASGQTSAKPSPGKTAETGGETAETLIAKNIQARGGLEKIKSIQSIRMTGTMKLGDDDLPTLLELKRPNKSRWEFTLEGATAVQAYDGRIAWTIMPFEGSSEPRIMSDQEARDVEMQADIDGPFVDSAAKGITIKLVGKETIEGVEMWKLLVSREGSGEREIYLDARTYLQALAVSRKSGGPEGPIEIRSRVSDYRNVGGVMLPHSFVASAEGIPQKQALEFSKIELNVPIDDSRFAMPKGKNEPPAMGGQ
jgi:outer membrane lipoprotein-sorting protein